MVVHREESGLNIFQVGAYLRILVNGVKEVFGVLRHHAGYPDDLC